MIRHRLCKEWYPHVRGHRTMLHRLRDGEPVMEYTLKEAGYFAWWNGKKDLVPAQHSYEEYCNVKYQPCTVGEAWWAGQRHLYYSCSGVARSPARGRR